MVTCCRETFTLLVILLTSLFLLAVECRFRSRRLEKEEEEDTDSVLVAKDGPDRGYYNGLNEEDGRYEIVLWDVAIGDKRIATCSACRTCGAICAW